MREIFHVSYRYLNVWSLLDVCCHCVIDLHKHIAGHHLSDFVISVQIPGCIAPRCQLTRMRISPL